VFAIEIRYGQKISQHFASKVLGLPIDDKLARSPRNKFCASVAHIKTKHQKRQESDAKTHRFLHIVVL
jgi:hypothetical protein